MSTSNDSINYTSISTLEDRITVEAAKQQHDLRESYAEVSALPKSRLARHASLVVATRRAAVLTFDIIDFYSRRYTGNPAEYTHTAAIATAQAAGLSYADARDITIKAIRLNVQPSEYRAFVDAHVDMKKAAVAERNAKNAAKLAEIKARPAAVA